MNGAATGLAAGGLLGQVGDVLSAPRRSLWALLGLPDSGASLVSQSFGLDEGGLPAKLLGLGAEMALDPLTYAGAPIGGALSKVLGGAGKAAGGLGAEISGLAAARRAAMEGLVERAAQGENAAEAVAGRLAGLQHRADVPGMVEAEQKAYKLATPEAIDALEAGGLGVGTGDGAVSVYGGRRPDGSSVVPTRGEQGRLAGSHLAADGGADLAQVSPYERYLLMSKGQEEGGGKALSSAISGALSPAELSTQVGAQVGAEHAAALPYSTLREQMLANFMPHSALDVAERHGLGGLPINDAFDATQTLLSEKQQALKALREQMTLGRGDVAAAAGAGGLSAYLGGVAGLRRDR